MKKLVDLVKLQQVTEGYLLEQEYMVSRKELKAYLRSLHRLKKAVKVAHNCLLGCAEDIQATTLKYGEFTNKECQLDYFTSNGSRIFPLVRQGLSQPLSTYSSVRQKISNLVDKIEVNLVQSKQTIGKHSAAHAEVVQDYASKCYPETTSILFLLGLVAVEKLQKVQDALKEKGVKEEAKMFTGVLKDTMEQMETLKEEALKLGHEFYLGVSHDWKEMTLIVSEGLKQFRIDEDVLENYHGADIAATDRSGRSFKSIDAIDA